MRYEELPAALKGWTYDEHGTIYTASGYRCTARTLECALWLFESYRSEARRYLIRSDEAPGSLRQLYDIADTDSSGQITPAHFRIVEESQDGFELTANGHRASMP